MTQEEKQLVLKDLCARAIYRPFVQLEYGAYNKPEIRWLTGVYWPDRVYINGDSDYYNIEDIKPYLRPMSSMTEEKKDELYQKTGFKIDDCILGLSAIDWLNEHHFDHRGLIPMGLALEVPEGMYKSE